jgi:hypothetical protein
MAGLAMGPANLDSSLHRVRARHAGPGSPDAEVDLWRLSFANNLSADNGLTFSAVETKNRGSCRP